MKQRENQSSGLFETDKVRGGGEKKGGGSEDGYIFMHPSSGTLVDHRSLVDCTARRRNRTTIRR